MYYKQGLLRLEYVQGLEEIAVVIRQVTVVGYTRTTAKHYQDASFYYWRKNVSKLISVLAHTVRFTQTTECVCKMKHEQNAVALIENTALLYLCFNTMRL